MDDNWAILTQLRDFKSHPRKLSKGTRGTFFFHLTKKRTNQEGGGKKTDPEG